MWYHSEFPNNSIVVYNKKKSHCTIAKEPTYRVQPKVYIRTSEYEENVDVVAYIPNFDHFTVFATTPQSWIGIKPICDKHNALFYLPRRKSYFNSIINTFPKEHYHLGMHLKDGVWITEIGTNVTQLFWDQNSPDPNPKRKCGGVTDKKEMDNIVCEGNLRKGLCIY